MRKIKLGKNENFKVLKLDGAGYYHDEYQSDVFGIVLLDSGNLNVIVNDEEFSLHQGSTFLVLPGDNILIKDIEEECDITFLLTSKELFGDAASRLEHYVFEAFYKDRWINSSTVGPARNFFLNIIANLEFIYENKGFYQYEQALCQFRSLLCYAADKVREVMNKGEAAKFNRLEEHFRKFVSELSLSYKQSREVAFYADKLHLSAKYLNYICVSVAKSTCKLLIDKYVIMQLKSELRTSQKSIQEIAYDYNFANQSFLGCYFKKFVGTSPRKYRNGDNFIEKK